MSILKAAGIAFSTYSVLPMPNFEWTEGNMRFSLCALPFVGLPLGALLLLWNRLCAALGIGAVMFAAVAAALPILYTGGIHMDGYCDTVDAVSSRQPRERKLEILKDPHTGAFAVIYACVYLLLSFGFLSGLYSTAVMPAVCVGFVLSRVLTVLSAVTMQNARKNGMLAAFTNSVQRRAALVFTLLLLALCLSGMTALHPLTGLVCALIGAVWFFMYRGFARRQFGGATGDTTGFFLQVTELLLLAGANLTLLLEQAV